MKSVELPESLLSDAVVLCEFAVEDAGGAGGAEGVGTDAGDMVLVL
jgi:hypothetical protein